MTQFNDHGIILGLRPHGESGAIVSVLTENHGKCNGYVNGARSSQRLRSVLQQGNGVSFEWQAKAEGQLGRFDLESEGDISAAIMSDAKALLAVQSLCALTDMFVPEREIHTGLFHGSNAFLGLLGGDNWAPAYIMWEMAFLKEMGYGLDLSKCAASGTTETLTHVSPKSGCAVCAAEAEPYLTKLLPIPQFLQGLDLDDDDIAHGLNLTGYFLIHRLLAHSSYHSLPEARLQLENKFNLATIAA